MIVGMLLVLFDRFKEAKWQYRAIFAKAKESVRGKLLYHTEECMIARII